MSNLPSIRGHTWIHHGWELAYDSVEMLVMAVFLIISLFPGNALAFANYVELSHLQLVFERDPSLEGVAIVGIDGRLKYKTVAGVLAAGELTVQSSLSEGSAVRVLATAYSSTYDQTDASPFMTASGKRVAPGTIAANFLPFGSRVRIGSTIYTVWDRMNARYNNKYIVDIWKPSRLEAFQYGARVVEMEVLSVPAVSGQ